MENRNQDLTKELLVALGRIEGQNTLILYRLDQQAHKQDETNERLDSTEERVSKVERKLNWYTAYAAGAAGAVALAFYAIKAKLWEAFGYG